MASQIDVATNSDFIFEKLKYVIHHAEQDFPVEHKFSYTVRKNDDEYELSENYEVFSLEKSAENVLTLLFEKIHRSALSVLHQYARIHAGSGEYNGRRFLIVGEQNAGKSTLMTYLAYSGYNIFGDELALFHKGEFVTFPRKFYIREGSLKFLPTLAENAYKLPFIYTSDQSKIFAFDLKEAGLSWSISAGPVDAIFYLESNHGAKSRLKKCKKYKMAQYVMQQTNQPKTGGSSWIGDLCSTLNSCGTYILQNGELGSARQAIEKVLN